MSLIIIFMDSFVVKTKRSSGISRFLKRTHLAETASLAVAHRQHPLRVAGARLAVGESPVVGGAGIAPPSSVAGQAVAAARLGPVLHTGARRPRGLAIAPRTGPLGFGGHPRRPEIPRHALLAVYTGGIILEY